MKTAQCQTVGLRKEKPQRQVNAPADSCVKKLSLSYCSDTTHEAKKKTTQKKPSRWAILLIRLTKQGKLTLSCCSDATHEARKTHAELLFWYDSRSKENSRWALVLIRLTKQRKLSLIYCFDTTHEARKTHAELFLWYNSRNKATHAELLFWYDSRGWENSQ